MPLGSASARGPASSQAVSLNARGHRFSCSTTGGHTGLSKGAMLTTATSLPTSRKRGAWIGGTSGSEGKS